MTCRHFEQGAIDKSEIQEDNPPKTVAPPLQLQPLNEERHIG